MNKNLKILFNAIAKWPVLTPEEEVRLAKLVQEGDKEAREKLINCNLKFVVKVAKELYPDNVHLEDKIQQGVLGLIYAVDTFDHTRGFKLISYAVNCIRQYIVNSGRTSSTITLPGHLFKLKSKVEQLMKGSEKKLNLGEIAEELEVPVSWVEECLSINPKGIRIEEKLERSLVDEEEGEENDFLSMKAKIQEHVDTLPERQADIIVFRLGLFGTYPRTRKEVAKRFNLAVNTVAVEENIALTRLKSLNLF